MLFSAEAHRVRMGTQFGASHQAEDTRRGGGFDRVAKRVDDLMSKPALQEQALQAVEQVAVLRDVDGELKGQRDAFADKLLWDAVETLMEDPIIKAEARRLAITFALEMKDAEFARQVRDLSGFIVRPEVPELQGQLFNSFAEVEAATGDSSTIPKNLMASLLMGLAAPASAFNIPMNAPNVHQQGATTGLAPILEQTQRASRVDMKADFDPFRLKGSGPQPLNKFVPDLIKAVPTPNAAAAALTAAAVALHAEVANAKSVVGVNGALDFGPLAGDQPGGEGTGKALGINDDTLGFVLFAGVFGVGLAWGQWQSYQDDDEDYFDAYDSRRVDREITNRNRV